MADKEPQSPGRALRILSILLALVTTLPACRKSSPPDRALQTVEFATARSGDVPLYIDTFGNAVTISSVTIQPQVTGILKTTSFEEGSFVKKGDVLFEIDPAPYNAALQQAVGNVESAKATLDNAKINLVRQQELLSKRVSDQQTADNAQADALSAQGAYDTAIAQYEQAKINLGYCTIQSPIEGKTGVYLVNTGNLVNQNQTQLVNIQTMQPIYVDYTISERDAAKTAAFLSAADRENLEVRVSIPGLPDSAEVGKLDFIDNKIQPDTGTVKLRAIVPNAKLSFWPGMYLDVRLILRTEKDAVLMPTASVMYGQDGAFVFVLNPDQSVTQRPVTLGQLQGSDVVVTGGLKAGESVVTMGQLGLVSGVRVTSRPAPTPSNSPAPGR